jgi:predicted phosphohydrolase
MSLNDFFAKIPHKHKIFVAGNHDIMFDGQSCEDVQKKLPNVTYLQDSSVYYSDFSFAIVYVPNVNHVSLCHSGHFKICFLWLS